MKKRLKKKVCPKCKQKTLVEEYEDCNFCGGGIVLMCSNADCCAMLDENKKEL